MAKIQARQESPVQWGIPTAPTRACPLSQGMQSLSGTAAGDGLMGAKAELDASYMLHGKFVNVSEQGQVPKQITMQDTAHPSPPSCPQFVLYLPCLRGKEGSALSRELSHSTTKLGLCAGCQHSPALTPCLAAAGVRWGQPSLCTGWAGRKD